MNRQDDKKAMFDIMPADTASSDEKPSLSRRLINKTLQHAQDAVEFASDTSRNIAEVADAALDALDHVTHHTKRGVEGVRNSVRGMVTETSEAARQVALSMARASLGRSSLTLYLPEMLLNNQIRKRIDRSEIDDIKVECGNDRFHIELDGHYHRFLYRLSLEFNVLECRIGQEKYLRLRQVDEHLDLQVRHGGTLTNWATRRVGNISFDLINSLPIPFLINHLIRDVPGIQKEGHRIWYIDLEEAGFIDFINNRSWMVDKLLNLSDFSILPGLNILQESRELVQQLVDQFEIRGLRVQSGRLEVQVGIGIE
ncbi:hypothetical protein L313_2122 [Acinetobacter haemolyticus CIP 64.3 = MTCC 9819]|uniref:Uncharacterized protein n=1 Tax=Acinetobacter haemolyticus CIP 64.3 = MTCC 9819 TaxID=1217659 RepID=N9GT21_ACIHA|nr:hypothetical protein F927_00719 [Acinetobacter haemolyticus CIP 64.3 = MTCC 9819]EPR88747.1 hypothetical protein L313_2122 [Acinetobacter haemolyticus CIP 64.3 = MTCC 9819]QXZ27803.1 hypothetical protein I6L22_05890 [Acinetobacter haemolyticus]SPT47371.1 Uncharacterised protein [Acinetobacter haemolyticus]SUU54637.1 Uncharacterised protein [Acinetobacter haemolyticus]